MEGKRKKQKYHIFFSGGGGINGVHEQLSSRKRRRRRRRRKKKKKKSMKRKELGPNPLNVDRRPLDVDDGEAGKDVKASDRVVDFYEVVVFFIVHRVNYL
jgi:hypothetical protein